jgi:hypothetical protein
MSEPGASGRRSAREDREALREDLGRHLSVSSPFKSLFFQGVCQFREDREDISK